MAVSLDGLQPEFRSRLQRLLDASHGSIWVNSGYRSYAKQVALYAAAVLQYGPTKASIHVARPGHSNHEKGEAADLGGALGLAHSLAPQFDLHFPMWWENWHIERTDLATNPGAYTPEPLPGTPGEAMASGKYAGWVFPRDPKAVNGRFPFYAVTPTGDMYNWSIPDGGGIRSLHQIYPDLKTAPIVGIGLDPEGSNAVVLVAEDGGTFKLAPGQ